MEIGDGIIIPGDEQFTTLQDSNFLYGNQNCRKLVYGSIAEITNFGAFIDLGVMRGMIHISQTMNDYVTFSKTDSLTGKVSKRALKSGDLCLARIVAISHKGGAPKIGITMRQPGLGKLEWIKEDNAKKDRDAKRAAKEGSDEKKGKGKKEKKK